MALTPLYTKYIGLIAERDRVLVILFAIVLANFAAYALLKLFKRFDIFPGLLPTFEAMFVGAMLAIYISAMLIVKGTITQ